MHYGKRVFTKPIVSLCLLIALAIIPQTGCGENGINSASANQGTTKGTAMEEPVSKDGYYLDTVCTITVYGMEEGASVQDAEAAIDDAFSRCEELEKKLSNKIEDSEISKINEAAGTAVTVSPETVAILEEGVAMGELSGGDFDITIGPVTSLWDFHEPEKAVVPEESVTEQAASLVDYTKVVIINREDHEADALSEVTLGREGMKLDLGGIAKGYISDDLANVLMDRGVTSAIINLGGNVVTIGEKPEGAPFVIGIEKPFSDRTEIIGSVSVRDKAVITSGIYERFFEKDGEFYHHILDPKTGRPATTDLMSVSLVAARGRAMELDALSTVCLIQGADEAKALIEGIDGIEGIFCKEDGTILITEGMAFTPAD